MTFVATLHHKTECQYPIYNAVHVAGCWRIRNRNVETLDPSWVKACANEIRDKGWSNRMGSFVRFCGNCRAIEHV